MPRRGPLRSLLIALALSVGTPADPHDLERTQVLLTLSRDGSFVLDVSNDPAWLKLRLESIPGPFADRIVLWVDGREVRPGSDETLTAGALTVHRLRGSLPTDARTLRWYYGLVIDPYPLTVRHADGRIQTDVIAGDAWSPVIELRGEFERTSRWPIYLIAGLFAAGIFVRIRSWPRRREGTKKTT